MLAMMPPFLRRWLPTFSLLVGLVVLLPACGGMGDNEDDGDDGAFPEPPDRPSAQVVTPIPSPETEPGTISMGRRG